MFHVFCIFTWAELDFYLFQYARINRVNKGQVNARRCPVADAVMAINSSAAPVFRQRWTGVPCWLWSVFIKSCSTSSATCTCIITSQACLHLLTSRGVLGWLLVVVLFAPIWGGSLGICSVCWMLCTALYGSTSLQQSSKGSCSLLVSGHNLRAECQWCTLVPPSTAEPMQHPHECWRWCRLW